MNDYASTLPRRAAAIAAAGVCAARAPRQRRRAIARTRDDLDLLVHRRGRTCARTRRTNALADRLGVGGDRAVRAARRDRQRVLLADVAHVEAHLPVACRALVGRAASSSPNSSPAVRPPRPCRRPRPHDPGARRRLREVGAEQAPGREVAGVAAGRRSSSTPSSSREQRAEQRPGAAEGDSVASRGSRPCSIVISRIASAMLAAAIVMTPRATSVDRVEAERARRAARARASACSRVEPTPPASLPVGRACPSTNAASVTVGSVAAAAVAGGPGIGAGALRADAQEPAGVDVARSSRRRRRSSGRRPTASGAAGRRPRPRTAPAAGRR